MRWFLALLVLLFVATPAIAAAPGDPGITSTPTPPSHTSSTEDANANANATSPSPGGGGGLFGWLFGGKDKARTQSASLVQQLALSVVGGIAYVPAPNNAADWFLHPTNGMWEERWNYRQNTVMPLFWLLAAAFFLIYLIDEVAGVLPERHSRGWFRRLRRGVVLGYFSATLAGVWLSFRQGLTMLLLQDVTAATVEANLSAAVVLLAVLFLLITDSWAIATLALIIGAVIVAIPAAYPWLPVLFILGAAPSRIASLIASLLVKAWFILGALTLPIAALVGFGFSLEVTPQLSESAMAFSSGQYAAFMTEAVSSILTFAAKFGSLVIGVILAHKMLGLLDLGGAMGLPQVIPQKQDVRAGAYEARDRAGTARDRVGVAAGAGRNAVQSARDGRARDVASSVRTRLGSLRTDGGKMSTTDRWDGVQTDMAAFRDEQRRQARLRDQNRAENTNADDRDGRF